jgi:adenosylcobyric acid synthase
MRDRGIADAVLARARAGRPVLGICGGYQMLAATLEDDVESAVGRVPGLDLLPTHVRFETEKVLARPTGSWRGHDVTAYEIHHGIAHRLAGADDAEPFLDGWRRGSVWGTTWHGAFESDDFRRAWLAAAAEQAGVGYVPSSGPGFVALREAMVDALADAVEEHLDTAALWRLIEGGAGPRPG